MVDRIVLSHLFFQFCHSNRKVESAESRVIQPSVKLCLIGVFGTSRALHTLHITSSYQQKILIKVLCIADQNLITGTTQEIIIARHKLRRSCDFCTLIQSLSKTFPAKLIWMANLFDNSISKEEVFTIRIATVKHQGRFNAIQLEDLSRLVRKRQGCISYIGCFSNVRQSKTFLDVSRITLHKVGVLKSTRISF